MNYCHFFSEMHHARMKKGIRLILFIIILVSPIFIHYSKAQTNQRIIRIGFYDDNLDENSRSAVTESMKVWIEMVNKHTEYKPLINSIVETKFYSSSTEIQIHIQNKTFDIMSLTGWDFFRFNLKEKVVPVVVSSLSLNSKFERYYLITHKDSRMNDFSKLSNLEISVPKSNSSYLIKAWLKVELIEKLGRKKFSKINILETNQNENQTILSIFFNKKGLTVVREGAYLTACELNPQIKNSTSIISLSPNFINYFLAVSKDIDPEIHKALIKESLKLPGTVEGRQILDIMQTEGVYILDLSDLRETEQLFNRYNKLF